MTTQINESLLLDGEAVRLSGCPPLPREHPRIERARPEERLREEGCAWRINTACSRGYVGHWAVRDWRFYLIGLTGAWRLRGSEPLLADWFSGRLVVPGERPFHRGFGTPPRQERQLEVRQGIVIGRCFIDRRPRRLDWDLDVDEIGWAAEPAQPPGARPGAAGPRRLRA